MKGSLFIMGRIWRYQTGFPNYLFLFLHAEIHIYIYIHIMYIGVYIYSIYLSIYISHISPKAIFLLVRVGEHRVIHV